MGDHLRRLKYESKLQMQMCAVLSQQDRHEEALQYARTASKFSHVLIGELEKLCARYAKKIECSRSKQTDSGMTSPISLMEVCSIKLLPILRELQRRTVPLNSAQKPDPSTNDDIDMRSMFGFLSLGKWSSGINIGSLMQIGPMKMQDLCAANPKEIELSRESIVEKVALLVTSYFCIATESRFLYQQDHPVTSQYAYNEPSKER